MTRIFASTREGLWIYSSSDRGTWKVEGPQHFGAIVHG